MAQAMSSSNCPKRAVGAAPQSASHISREVSQGVPTSRQSPVALAFARYQGVRRARDLFFHRYCTTPGPQLPGLSRCDRGSFSKVLLGQIVFGSVINALNQCQ